MKRAILCLCLVGLVSLSGCGGGKGSDTDSNQGQGYKLVIETQGPGSVKVNPELKFYPVGSEVTLTAVPNEGSYLYQWGEGIPSEEQSHKSIKLRMDGNKRIKPQFTHNYSFYIQGESTTEGCNFHGGLDDLSPDESGNLWARKCDAALLTVNGTPLGNHASNNVVLSLVPEEIINFVIQHESDDPITANLTYPLKVTGLKANNPQDLTNWTQGVSNNLTLSWNDIPCQYYLIWFKFYDNNGHWLWKMMFGTVSMINQVTIRKSASEFANSSDVGYAEVYIIGVKHQYYLDYANSYIEMEGPIGETLSNLPSNLRGANRVNRRSIKRQIKNPDGTIFTQEGLTKLLIQKGVE